MTPQEEQLLNSLVERLNSTPLQEKDPGAEALLTQKLAGNPDALYMLAQTVLVQNIALDQAKAKIALLQQPPQEQRPQPAHATSFLGRLLGDREPAAQQAPAPPYQPVNPQYIQQVPQYAPPQYQQPQYVPGGGGQPSFLRGAMQTAAGVAAGALAFEGVESILHGFSHGGYGFGGPGMGMGGFDRPIEETVINNYYDEPGRGGMEHGGEHHLSDQGGAHFADASYNTQGDQGDNLRAFDQEDTDTSSSFDDSNLDDGSGFDDSGSFDDGGGFDDSGGGL